MFEVPFFNWIFLFFLLVLETPLIMSVFCVCAWVCVCSISAVRISMFFCFYNMSLLFVPFTICLFFFPSQSEHPWTTWTGSDGATPDRKNHVKPWNELRAHGGASPLRAMQTVQVPSKRKKNNTGKQNNRQNRQRKKKHGKKGRKI